MPDSTQTKAQIEAKQKIYTYFLYILIAFAMSRIVMDLFFIFSSGTEASIDLDYLHVALSIISMVFMCTLNRYGFVLWGVLFIYDITFGFMSQHLNAFVIAQNVFFAMLYGLGYFAVNRRKMLKQK